MRMFTYDHKIFNVMVTAYQCMDMKPRWPPARSLRIRLDDDDYDDDDGDDHDDYDNNNDNNKYKDDVDDVDVDWKSDDDGDDNDDFELTVNHHQFRSQGSPFCCREGCLFEVHHWLVCFHSRGMQFQ